MKSGTIIMVFLLIPFFPLSQNRYDVVIDEIMADPSPQLGLPNNEWIELRNISTSPANLKGWRIGDPSGMSGPFSEFILQPDSFVIICSSSAVSALSSFGHAIPVTSFPSLDNNSDLIFLRSANGTTIHAVSYSVSWYQNELKKQGGWTLEMIDPQNPCAGITNWKASMNPAGGTPGSINSVDAILPDQTGPGLKNAYMLDSITIIAVYDEPVDSMKGATTGNYEIGSDASVVSAVTIPPLFDKVELILDHPLLAGKIYSLTVINITDCNSNPIGPIIARKIGLPQEPDPTDMVINEILFNPRPNEYDYVEFYNKSEKIIDISKLFAANRNSNGVISSIKQIFPDPFYIFPGEYLVISEDISSLQSHYQVQNPEAMVELPSLPSYPDDEGDVILLNQQGAVIDEVKYKDDWHFKLIENADGVSLERIDPKGPSQQASNWHSAASTAGYGTPSFLNSQYKQTTSGDATIQIIPKIFSPDNDGRDDFTSIFYKVPDPGYIANVTVFDSQGRPVRYVVKNEILGISGQWNWDGLDEKGNRLPTGIYIIYSEIFNLRANKKYFKNAVVITANLN